MTKLNLPNKITLARLILVPVFMIVLMLPLPDTLSRIVSAVLFIGIALTDMFDGKIARGRGLITDFGKLLDPIADSFMIFGAMLAILAKYHDDDLFRTAFMAASSIVILRELAITSIRLVAKGASGIVIAASMLGKIKTVVQIACIVSILLEPVVIGGIFSLFGVEYPFPFLSYFLMAAMVVLTVWSGADYIKKYWRFLDPTK